MIYPSKTELENQIKKYLSGLVTLEVIKNESFVVFEDELKKAYKIANDMVDSYKMENDSNVIISRLKDSLKSEILINIDEIKKIKKILLKDEVVVF